MPLTLSGDMLSDPGSPVMCVPPTPLPSLPAEASLCGRAVHLWGEESSIAQGRLRGIYHTIHTTGPPTCIIPQASPDLATQTLLVLHAPSRFIKMCSSVRRQ